MYNGKTAMTMNQSEQSGFDTLTGNSLRAAGFAYLVGDAAIIATGMLEKDLKKVSVGAMWGLGGLAAARYGNPNAEKQLELFSAKLGAYLKKQGVAIPDTPETHLLAKEGGIIDHIESFLYAHPSEALNAVYAIGAAQLIRSGMKKSGGKALDFMPDIISGALVGAGALAGLLIPEKKPEPGKQPDGIEGWIQEKPLRVSGALYAANNAAMLWGAHKKQKQSPQQGSHVSRYLTAAAYIFANTMLFLSNRNQTEDVKHDLTGRLCDAAAHVVAAQPPETRATLMQQVAGFMASQPDIHRSANEIASLLNTRLATIENPRWQHVAANTTGTGELPPHSR